MAAATNVHSFAASTTATTTASLGFVLTGSPNRLHPANGSSMSLQFFKRKRLTDGGKIFHLVGSVYLDNGWLLVEGALANPNYLASLEVTRAFAATPVCGTTLSQEARLHLAGLHDASIERVYTHSATRHGSWHVGHNAVGRCGASNCHVSQRQGRQVTRRL